MKIGVVGASGYAGGELLRLIENHPEFEVSYIAAGSNAGESITKVHSHLIGYRGRNFSGTELSEINKCDLVFLALPHGESGKLAAEINSDVKVVDLGADFRLRKPEDWAKYYDSSYSGSWTYGLPELGNQRELIKNSTRVANPGCYATAIAVGAAPALNSAKIDHKDIVVVAASGTTGAGRSAKVNLLGSEVMNSLTSYKFGGIHQHTPEIEQALSELHGDELKISFTPILAPMPRGILATITMKSTATIDEIRTLFSTAYANEKFVSVMDEGQMPETSAVIGSNAAHLQVAQDEHAQRVVISVAIDNLGKGAAGQAIQNANLMAGISEQSGLSATGIGQ